MVIMAAVKLYRLKGVAPMPWNPNAVDDLTEDDGAGLAELWREVETLSRAINHLSRQFDDLRQQMEAEKEGAVNAVLQS
jgi:molecular chaperone GrpE (heat shock protein)